MNKSVLIQSILDGHPIIEYLSSKGYEPARHHADRYKYSCPLHGPEKVPSFYVFTGKENQYFHCFGCKAHGDIINLVSLKEGMSIKAAIGKLAWGLDIPESEIVERLAVDIENSRSKDDLTIEEIALRFSRSFYSLLEWTNKDPQEVAFMERVFDKVDRIIHAMDLETLKEVYDQVIDVGIPARKAAYLLRKDSEDSMRYKSNNAPRPNLQQVMPANG